jgi:hypothetical protein
MPKLLELLELLPALELSELPELLLDELLELLLLDELLELLLLDELLELELELLDELLLLDELELLLDELELLDIQTHVPPSEIGPACTFSTATCPPNGTKAPENTALLYSCTLFDQFAFAALVKVHLPPLGSSPVDTL